MQIHVQRGEEELGIFSPEQTTQYLAEGRLLETDLAWHEGMENWIAVAELVEELEGNRNPTFDEERTVAPKLAEEGAKAKEGEVRPVFGGGRYKREKLLGQGGMGQVWLAHDKQLDRQVAVKVVRKKYAANQKALNALKAEVKKSLELTHPNIIRIYDLNETPGEDPFISMEYIEGEELSERKKKQPGQRFSWEEMEPYTLKLCEALEYAHEQGMVHRDLKPQNVILTGKDELKLADFGIAARSDDDSDISMGIAARTGTPIYWSPQQAQGFAPTETDDIYCLGVMLYELLVGEPPFKGPNEPAITRQHIKKPPPDPQTKLEELGCTTTQIPEYISELILKCLAKDSVQRPQSAREIREWILAKGTPSTSGEQSPSRSTSSRPMPKAIAAAVAVSLVFASVMFIKYWGLPGITRKHATNGESVGQNKQPPSKSPAGSVPVTPDALQTGLVAYYPFNGNANDESGNGNHGTAIGATITADRHGISERAYSFDGTNDFVDLGNKSAFNFGTGDFSFSLWLKFSGTQNNKYIIGKSINRPCSLLGTGGDSDGYAFFADGSSGQDGTEARSRLNLSDNNWHHLTVVFDRDSYMTIYVDGSVEAATDISGEPGDITNPGNLYIGKINGGQNFGGKIDEVRIYNRALTDKEVTTLYNLEKPKDSLDKGLVAYYPFNGNANDESGNGNDGEVKGASLTTDRTDQAKRAYNFNGINDSITVGNINIDGSFTVFTWVFIDPSVNDRGQAIYVQGGTGPDEDDQIWFGHVAGKIMLHVGGGGSRIRTNTNIEKGEWICLAACWDGVKATIYIKGLKDHESPKSEGGSPLRDPLPTGGCIGRDQILEDGDGFTNDFKGKIDEVRIYNRALTDKEVTTLYNLEKPKDSLDKGLVAYYPFNGNANDESGNGNDGEVKGATLAADRHGEDRKAFNFDGVDDLISVSETEGFEGNAHTLALWVKTDDARASVLLCKDGETRGVRQWQIGRAGGQIQANIWTTSGEKILEKSDLQTNWKQVIQTWNGEVLKLFINGQFMAEISAPGQLASSDEPVRIGAGKNRYFFKGTIDDIRIYNRALSAVEATELYELEKPKTSPAKPPTLLTFKGHKNNVTCVAWSPDGTKLASSSLDKTAKVWDASTGKEIRTFEHDWGVGGVAWSPDGTKLVGAGDGGKIWEVATGKVLQPLKGDTLGVSSVAWSPDGGKLATGAMGFAEGGGEVRLGEVKIWDAASGQELHSLKGHNNHVACVAWSPDGKRLASGSEDKTLRVWNATTGAELTQVGKHPDWVFDVAWSPDGTKLASAEGWGENLKVWDEASGKELLTLKGHTAFVSTVAWSPDGSMLSSGSYGGVVKVWDAGTGKELHQFNGHTNQVMHVAWSPDGKRLASASHDKTVRIWRIVSANK